MTTHSEFADTQLAGLAAFLTSFAVDLGHLSENHDTTSSSVTEVVMEHTPFAPWAGLAHQIEPELDHLNSTAQHVFANAQTVLHHCETTIDGLASQLTALVHDLGHGWESFGQDIQHFSSSHHADWQGLSQMHGEFLGQLAAYGSHMSSNAAQLEGHWSEFETQIQNTHQALGIHWLDVAASAANAELVTAIPEAFQHLSGELQEQWTQLLAASGRSVEELSADARSAFTSFATDAQQQCETHALQAMRDAIDTTLQSFVEEMVTQTGVMTVGSQITSAMSPILPELVAAKLVLHEINQVMDMFHLF